MTSTDIIKNCVNLYLQKEKKVSNQATIKLPNYLPYKNTYISYFVAFAKTEIFPLAIVVILALKYSIPLTSNSHNSLFVEVVFAIVIASNNLVP